jgi:diguanylate cyclase (GGDEF)-like protein
MDGLTLLIISLILSALIAFLWLIGGSVFKASPSTSFHYALCNVFLGAFMLLYVFRDDYPKLAIFCSDVALILGCFCLRRAVQDFTEIKKTDFQQIVLIVLALAVDIPARWFSYDQKLAVLAVCFFSMYTFLAAAQEAYRYMIKDFARKYCIITLMPLYLMGLLIFSRILLTLLSNSSTMDLRQASVFNTAFLLTMMLAVLGFNGTAIGLVVSRMITKIKHLSQQDPLTHAFNRRHLNTLAEKEIMRSNKNGKALSIIMLDIDHFKKVNDMYGHAAGDQALLTCVEVIKNTVRASDFVGRLGGEEFCIVLPDTQLKDAQALAERIRQKLENTSVLWENKVIPITASFGISSLGENNQSQWSKLLNNADQAMYMAKNNGRNKVMTSS